MPRLQSFYDNEPLWEPEGGILFERRNGSKEFVSACGSRIDVRDVKRSFLRHIPTVTVSEGCGWFLDLGDWNRHMGSVRWGNYAAGELRRFGPGEPESLNARVCVDWSRCEVTGTGIHLFGLMDSDRFALKDEEGRIVARGWSAWRESHRDRGLAEFFWYDGESCVDCWPALMLLLTQTGDQVRSAAYPLGD